MTKVAVIYTGELRTFAQCWPTHRWQVFRHFENLRFYFSLYGTVCQKDLPLDAEVEIVESQPRFEFNVDWIKGSPFTHEPYPISVSPQAVLGQLWQLEQGFKLYIRTTHEKDLADIVIRIRPDLWFHSFHYNGGYNMPNQCHTPWWGKFGGVNDRFSVMGRDAADHYFTTFSKLEKLRAKGCPIHPESLVRASLEDGHVEIHDDLKTEFSTLRTDGKMRHPEICGIDIAHLLLK